MVVTKGYSKARIILIFQGIIPAFVSAFFLQTAIEKEILVRWRQKLIQEHGARDEKDQFDFVDEKSKQRKWQNKRYIYLAREKGGRQGVSPLPRCLYVRLRLCHFYPPTPFLSSHVMESYTWHLKIPL